MSGATERFVVGDGAADVKVDVAWGDLSGPAAGETAFDSGGLWRRYRDGPDHVFLFTSPALGSHPYKRARFDSGFTRGEITLHAGYHDRDAPTRPLEYPLDEILVTNLLALGRGIEIHACGVRDQDGRGYLLAGHSGAGKTTSARLWEAAGALVLSDDRIILRVLDGRVWMYGTPWHGEAELAAADRTELNRILVLAHGSENGITRLAQPRVVAELFARSFVPFHDGEALGRSLDVLERVAREVPSAELRFVPDEKVVPFVREVAR